MKERPILFSGPMVRAILEGRKTVTRRVVKPAFPASVVEVQPFAGDLSAWMPVRPGTSNEPWEEQIRVCPYGKPGDLLWVREAHSIYSTHGQRREDGQRWGPWGGLPTRISQDGTQIAYYREGFDRCDPGRWRPSIHMPRWASRILLEITAVRVERLNDISDAQARAEGYPAEREAETGGSDLDAWLWFRSLWEEINGRDSFAANPWVWVVEFKRVEAASV